MNIAPSDNSTNTVFKIILNSGDTNTYTGNKYDATYRLDLKQILHNDIHFDKSYKMTFKIRTTCDPTISSAELYLATFLLSNGSTQQAIHQPIGSTTQTTGLLSSYYDSSLLESYIESQDHDNAPTYINSLRNINSVQVRITDHKNNVINLTDGDYIVILYFEQIGKSKNSTLTYANK